MLPQKDIDHIFERLRSGMVPERGINAFAVGIENAENEIKRQLGLTKAGEGTSKFLRGGYGCGKTFLGQLAILRAKEDNFVTSKVVVSSNDTPLYKFDELYARIVENLQTSMATGGTLEDCIDRWIAKIEDKLIANGENENSSTFDLLVKQQFEIELAELRKEQAGADFISAVKNYFDLKQEGNIFKAMQILAWLSGSRNIAAGIKRQAGIKGSILSSTAFSYLKGILLIIKKAGHPGLLIVVDEIETIMRMRSDIREKSLNAIRQILDHTPELKGIFWLFAGTPEFFDSSNGIKALPPLHDRIYFRKSGDFVNIKQPQLELKPFDKQRLSQVALRLRNIYPTKHKERINNVVSNEFIHDFVNKLSYRFGEHVAIIPRLFLREFVDILDLVDQNENYYPFKTYEISLKDMRPEEENAIETSLLEAEEDNIEDIVF